jgi:Tol biopolymer transport system component
MRFRACRVAASVLVGLVATVAVAHPGPGNAVLVSVGLSGSAGNGAAYEGTISNNGRYLAWHTSASDLGLMDSNGTWDVVLADRRKGTLFLVALDAEGDQATNGGAVYPAMSANGRWIVYQTDSTNIASGGAAGSQVVLADARTFESREISVGPMGEAGDGSCEIYHAHPISANGRWIVFSSISSNLAGGADGPSNDIFLADARTGELRLISTGLMGAPSDGSSRFPSISPNGRWIVFNSTATNLVPMDGNGLEDVFLHDVKKGTTVLVSRPSAGGFSNADSGAGYASAVSNSGRLVAFSSLATNLDPDTADMNPAADVFLADLRAGTVSLISLATDGGPANGPSGHAAMDAAGKVVTYRSEATNLNTPAAIVGLEQVAYDVREGTTTRMLHAVMGGPPNGPSYGLGSGMSQNGRWFLLNCEGDNVVPTGANGMPNVYLVDLKH